MRPFYLTRLAPCPYLPNRLERRVVTWLDAAAPYDALATKGFRRSQHFAYRPACPGCQACVPVRIPVAAFAPGRALRRVLRRNADLGASERPARATAEQYELFCRYQRHRHGGGEMAAMGWDEFVAMVEDTAVDTTIIELRDAHGRLLAASLTDRVGDGLSGVYKFFAPEEARRSLGSYVVLWHVERARALNLPYVYLGYWIAESPKMAYKARFQPLERLRGCAWEPLSPPAGP